MKHGQKNIRLEDFV